MKTKEEVVKEAWSNSTRSETEYNLDNGWSITHVIMEKTFFDDYFDTKWEYSSEGKLYACIRPKTLEGIEDNNGWTSMKNLSDLPNTNSDEYSIELWTEKGFMTYDNYIKYMTHFSAAKITHFKLKPVSKPPLFKNI